MQVWVLTLHMGIYALGVVPEPFPNVAACTNFGEIWVASARRHVPTLQTFYTCVPRMEVKSNG